MLENTFQTILVISVIGVLLTGMLLAIKFIFRKHFSAGWFYYIWLLVLVAMMVPVRVNWKHVQNSAVLSGMVSLAEEYLPLQEIRDLGESLRQEPEELYDEEGHRLVSTALMEKRIREITFERNLNRLSLTWLLVALMLLEARLLGYAYYLARIRWTTREIELPQVAEYTDRKVTVRKGDWIPSPMLLGVFRPILLLPERELTESQLRYVLSHEMTHLKRHDMVMKWFMVLVKSVHWFNPLVYWLEKQVEQECEISCDIAVTERMNAAQKKAYADTILMFLMRQRRREFSLSMGMAGTKGLLKKRFLRMKNATAISRGMKICSGLMTFVLLTVSVIISGNLMNRTFPYTGDSQSINTHSCTVCQVTTRYEGQAEVEQYNSTTKPGWYKQYIYKCPECDRKYHFNHFIREFSEEEWVVYEELQLENQRRQVERWMEIKAEIETN